MKEIKEQFVTYEIVLKLKELGFDEKCLGMYGSEFEFVVDESSWRYAQISKDVLQAPLWQQVIDFLREKYLLHIEIQSPDYSNDVNFSWSIHKISKFGSLASGESFDYHKVREQAILKAIELCKKN